MRILSEKSKIPKAQAAENDRPRPTKPVPVNRHRKTIASVEPLRKPVRAKLFQNGRSQAVRLPKEFRFVGKEVQITRLESGLLLEPVVSVREMSSRQFFEHLASFGDIDPMPGGRNQGTLQAEEILPEGW